MRFGVGSVDCSYRNKKEGQGEYICVPLAVLLNIFPKLLVEPEKCVSFVCVLYLLW